MNIHIKRYMNSSVYSALTEYEYLNVGRIWKRSLSATQVTTEGHINWLQIDTSHLAP